MPKVAVVGAGRVGMTAAYGLLGRGVDDIALIDIIEDYPQGLALDMMESASLIGSGGVDAGRIVGSNDFADVRGADVVAMTAGFPRKPGMSRQDLLTANAQIVRDAVAQVVKYAPGALLLVVTNPLDLMVHLALKLTGWGRTRVVGMGGLLDSARMRYFISEELGVPVSKVSAMVIGSHGDSMVPLPRHSLVDGRPLTEAADEAAVGRIVERTRRGGAEIVELMKNGSAFHAPGASVAHMVMAMLEDTGEVIPSCVRLEGEYGLSGVCLGVPVAIGRSGAGEVVELDLGERERAALATSAEEVRGGLVELEKLGY